MYIRKIYAILTVGLLAFSACQNEEEVLKDSGVGYLRLEVGADKTTITKTEEAYNPKQIAVKIIDETGKTVKETDDYTTWTDAIALTPGKYKISASSAGFDGTTAAWDKPYYAGLDSVTIVKGESVSKTVTCTLANVLVTVEFDSEFKKAFKSATVVVTDTVTASNKVTFTMNETTEKGKAYFPVTGLFADLAVTNQKDKIFSKKDTVEDVKARENVILRYKLGESSTGSTNIDITLDGTTKTYIYTIGVPLTATSTIVASGANAWSKFAYLNAEIPSFAGVFDQSKLLFEYKKSDDLGWSEVEGAMNIIDKGKSFSVKLVDLTPNTTYQYRVVYDRDNENIESDIVDFTTESATQLQNSGFEDWYELDKVWYAASQDNVTNGTYDWDTSNPGSGSYGFNPTSQSTTVKHGGNSSAKLTTEYAVIKLAAASLYYGRFKQLTGGLIPKGAKIDFGREFGSRPVLFKGYFQYAPVKIDNYNNPPAGTVQKGDMDICSIYIALSKKSYTIDNTDTSTFIDFEGDSNIIAYGELPADECVNTNGQWKEFNIPLKYKSLTEEPSYIIIVCSSSKYGDYFTGGEGSTMYLDDFELIYDGEPTLWK